MIQYWLFREMSESRSDEEDVTVDPGRDAGCCVSDEVASQLSEVGSWINHRSTRNVVVPPAREFVGYTGCCVTATPEPP